MKTIETTIYTRPEVDEGEMLKPWWQPNEDQRKALRQNNVAIARTGTSPTTQLEVIYFNTEKAMDTWKAKADVQAVAAARDAYNAANGITASATSIATTA